uniref:E3 ubiquitin-protein ligase MARCH1 n=1 Tax=Schistocephalus solidus TaxID=70667 RepID=A0A0X3P702_SCHSO
MSKHCVLACYQTQKVKQFTAPLFPCAFRSNLIRFIHLIGSLNLEQVSAFFLRGSYHQSCYILAFQWERLPLTTMERRRLICSVTFHVLALVTVIWSLFVLIERVIAEVQEQNMGWAFWTKLLVIAVGIGGGLIYTYVQWRLYVDLLVRWRDHNRVLLVQVPPKEALKAERTNRVSVGRIPGHEEQRPSVPAQPQQNQEVEVSRLPGNLSANPPPANTTTRVGPSAPPPANQSGTVSQIYTIFPVLPSSRPAPPPS